MKKVLIIGSTVVDVTIRLPHLPVTSEDINVPGQTMSLGGCAYNVSDAIRHFNVPYTLFSPIGKGPYGDFVRNALAAKHIDVHPLNADEENGCCYCLVEDTGERTFLCCRGAEYRFLPEWFGTLDMDEYDSIYLCGLELEEATGANIVRFLERVDKSAVTIYFAPGPRLLGLDRSLTDRILRLSPVLHLNEDEARAFTGESGAAEASRLLYELTGNTCIVTLGSRGAYYYNGTEASLVGVRPSAQIDTTGAGDAHIGSVIAGIKRGSPLKAAIRDANKVSAALVGVRGSQLPDEIFSRLFGNL